MDFYHFAKGVVFSVIKPLYRLEVSGLDNFPESGGILLCSNHIHNFDPLVMGISAPRPVNFMAKAELFNAPVLKGLLPKVHAFPVKRGLSDREALRTALRLLKSGEVVGMFPEGTRSKNGQLGEGLSGAGFFALRGDADVVPCAIIGKYRSFRKVRMIFGEPIDMAPYRERKASADEVTADIMKAIQRILDENENYKG
ncbi:lysophospholipid acyltransferase family protein [Indiicoccus explosivorum]|uniref:lysophospholipid acyltransferase family protein n=1 Tax=Indiicoccus explosivorum TaxID=1917864 RepID=UPI000B445004|nr:lysophospholipid acyltransferase family protein [Indiicoccus explosivorum]